jgi:hypothetical protein
MDDRRFDALARSLAAPRPAAVPSPPCSAATSISKQRKGEPG